MVSGGIEQGQSRLRQPLELGQRPRNDPELSPGDDRLGQQLPRLVAGGFGALGCGRSYRFRPRNVLRGPREVELEVYVEPVRPGQHQRPLEQAGRRTEIAARGPGARPVS
jgi:hypothetical protein